MITVAGSGGLPVSRNLARRELYHFFGRAFLAAARDVFSSSFGQLARAHYLLHDRLRHIMAEPFARRIQRGYARDRVMRIDNARLCKVALPFFR